MQKVLVAEIGSETTVVNAFSDLDTENPRLIGQGLSSTTLLDGDIGVGLRLAVTDLEKNIGSIGSLEEIPFYTTSSLTTRHAVREVSGQYIPDAPGMQEILRMVNGRILPTTGAIMQAAQLIHEEVGDVLVLDVRGASTDVYSVALSIDKHQKLNLMSQLTVEEDLGVFSNALVLVKLIGENRIVEHHGQGWGKKLNSKPETPEEIALIAELTASAITIALQRHIGQSCNYNGANGKITNVKGWDLSRIRWIVGTGVALTQLPNGLEIMKESINGISDALFPQEGIAILLDRDNIMASLGILTTTFRQGAWQLLRESFGVEN